MGTKSGVIMRKDREKPVLVPEAEQPFPIPSNWRWVYLPSICEYIKAGGDKPELVSNYKTDDLNIPVVANGVQNDGIIGYTNIEMEKAGSITVSGRGTIGFACLRNYSYYPVVRLIVISPRRNIVAGYLKYIFDIFEEKSTGTSIPQLTVPALRKKAVPLAPTPEQHRIVEHIESLFAKLDEAKEKAQKYVDKYEARRAAILYLAFTGELTAEWRNREQVNFEDWTTATLQSVCAMKITDGTHKTPTYCDKDKGFAFISAKDVTSGSISWDNIKYIIPELHEDLYARLAPQIDDVLLAKNGTTGVAAIVDTDRVFDLYVTLAVLRPNKTIIIPRYLLNVINSPICKQQFDEHLTGIGVPNLHLRDIKAVEIPLPPMQEQEQIVRVLDLLLYKEQQVKNLAESVINRIDVMKKAVLASAFRGELGTNDPSEPPVDIPALQEESS